jgi:proline iminopeptidase
MRLLLFVFFLSKAFFAYAQDTIEVPGGKLYAQAMGKGAPILVVHGGPGLSHSYLAPGLSFLGKDYQIIYYDQRASGNSPVSDSSYMTLDQFVQDIDRVRDYYKVNRITLIAHSWGGLLATLYSAKYAEHVENLILINSIGLESKGNNQGSSVLQKRFTREDSVLLNGIYQSNEFQSGQVKAYEQLLGFFFTKQFYDPTFAKRLSLNLPEDYTVKSANLQYLGKDLSEYDFRSELKKIRARTLIVSGDYDALYPHISNQLNSIEKAQPCVIKNAGHFPFIEKSQEFEKSVRDFLKD